MTCAQYIEQKWPVNGIPLRELVKDAVLHPEKLVVNQDIDNTDTSARLRGSILGVSITGTRQILAEAGEQPCWISCALNLAPSTLDSGMIRCSASLERTTPIDTDRSRSFWTYDGDRHYGGFDSRLP